MDYPLIFVLVHVASLRPVHWFLLCFYWCMVLPWGLSTDFCYASTTSAWYWLLLLYCLLKHTFSLHTFECSTVIAIASWSTHPIKLYIDHAVSLVSQPICLHILMDYPLIFVLVHVASLRPVHWFLLCFYWCMVLPWGLSTDFCYASTTSAWYWLLLLYCLLKHTFSLHTFECSTVIAIASWSTHPIKLYIDHAVSLVSQPICLHI